MSEIEALQEGTEEIEPVEETGDQAQEDVAAAATQAAREAAPPSGTGVEIVRGEREFHIGGTVIKEDDSTAGLSNEDVRGALKGMFPEVANATIRESSKDGKSIIEFLPQPGRKG